MAINSVVRATKLDKIFGTPVCAVLLAILCNILWGSAFPFIKLGYRLFSIDPANTASIFCLAGVRFMLGSVLVLLGSILLQGHAPHFPRSKPEILRPAQPQEQKTLASRLPAFPIDDHFVL